MASRPPSTPTSPVTAVDDDNISLSSTISSQWLENEQWVVEEVLAEHEDEDGKPLWLISWTGYDLYDATWEPEEHLGPQLLEGWENTKRKYESGEAEPFDIEEWRQAVRNHYRGKIHRHLQRNKKRKLLGEATTIGYGDVGGPEIPDIAMSDEESSDNGAPIIPPPNQSTAEVGKPSPPAVKQSSEKQKALPESSRRQEKADRTKPKERLRSPTPPRPVESRRQLPATTGYQGTARKPSTAAPAPAKLPSHPPPARAGGSTAVRNTKSTSGIIPLPSTTKQTTVASPKPPATTGAPKFQGLKAKRTASTNPAAVRSLVGNIFISGTQRKQRRTLADLMSDPTREKKFFNRKGTERKAELRGRDRENQAPPVLPAGLMPLDALKNAYSHPAGATPRLPSANQQRAPEQARLMPVFREATGTASAAPSTSDVTSDLSGEGEPPLKRRKSVRFADDDEMPFVDEPMDIDQPVDVDVPMSLASDGLFVSGPGALAGEGLDSEGGRPVAHRLSLKEYQNRTTSQTVEKDVFFGPAGSKVISVSFQAFPKESQPWITAFMNQRTITFTHVCNAEDFKSKAHELRPNSTSLASGKIVSTGNSAAGEAALEAVAESLRLADWGAVCHEDDFTLLVCPSRSDAWNPVFADANPSSPSETALRYVILQLFPFPLPTTTWSPGTLVYHRRREHYRKELNFDYERLLPPSVSRDHDPVKGHNFMLIVPQAPPTRSEFSKAVATWLRECNPRCQIFLAHLPGHWATYVEKIQTGTVIIHQAAIWNVRRFPAFLKLLSDYRHAFWALSDGIDDVPMFTALEPRGHIQPTGIPKITRLFPHGHAVLVTPSFLAAQPREAHDLVKWFSESHAGDAAWKLVTTAHIADFLQSLATNKMEDRRKLSEQQLGAVEKEMQANMWGLSEKECELRYATVLIVRRLLDGCRPGNLLESSQPYSAAEERLPLILVDESIDGADEQSLVNWFGWWSIMHLDRFRKFHVLGSGSTNEKRLSCYIRTPKYSVDSMKDSDAVGDTTDGAMEAEASPPTGPAAPSQRFTVFSGEAFRGELKSIWNEANRPKGTHNIKIILYHFAISYFGDGYAMQDFFGDPSASFFKSVADWWRYLNPFDQMAYSKNTYAGFFWTINGEWDPAAYTKDRLPQRYPWVAMYRPTNPDIRPYRTYEVIIWDLAFRDKFKGRSSIFDRELDHAQRYLIDFVRDKTPEKNSDASLERVWIGGIEPSTFHERNWVDGTLDFLYAALTDIKRHLPPRKEHLERQGFRELIAGKPRSVDLNPQSETSGSEAAVQSNRRQDSSTEGRTVFRPPQGDSSVKKSRCENDLFNATARALNQHSMAEGFVYTYRPTLEWYQEQKVEGRGFEHIDVDTWEKVMPRLGTKLAERKNSG